MHHAVKNPRTIRAWQLGEGSEMENLLVAQGRIVRHEGGQYELFSKEAVNGRGQLAKAGDFFKVDTVDGVQYPYPNDRAFFAAHHRHVDGDAWLQISEPVPVWHAGDEPCDEIQFLLDTERLHIDEQDPGHYFQAFLWGAPLSAEMDAAVVFYSLDRDRAGQISEISFNFVDRRFFEANYTLLD